MQNGLILKVLKLSDKESKIYTEKSDHLSNIVNVELHHLYRNKYQTWNWSSYTSNTELKSPEKCQIYIKPETEVATPVTQNLNHQRNVK